MALAMRRTAKILMAATILAAAGAVAASAQSRAGPNATEGVAALRSVIADPYAPVDPVLKEFSFSEAQYLVDELSSNEQRALNRAIHEHFIRLPSGVATAVRAKAGRSGTNNRG